MYKMNYEYVKHVFCPIIILGILVMNVSCKNHSTNDDVSTPTFDPKNRTTVQWIDSLKNFGRIHDGEKVEISFRFKNTGEKSLIITDVRPSCGCTIANKPEKPIGPGTDGAITAIFNSEGKAGIVHKSIAVYGNISNQEYKELIFEGEVVKRCE